jgi:hypothetical protein
MWFILGVSKLLIFSVHFSKLAPRLGKKSDLIARVPLLNQHQEARALQIGRTIKLCARYTPWNSNCFPQALAARLLLGLYGIPYALFLGLKRDPSESELKAHAWVAAGRIYVCGGESFSHYTVVGCFVSPLLHDTNQV